MVAKKPEKPAAKPAAKKRTVKKVAEPMETRIIFVIDKSGSMQGIRAETVGSINEQLSTLKKTAAEMGDVYVSYITFNTSSKVEFSNRDITSIYPITMDQFRPNGGTALRDAMGDAIMELQKRPIVHKNTAYLVICVTDGEENSSTRYSSAQISSLVETLTKSGNWTFTYLMANLSEAQREEFRQQYHASAGNMATFIPDSAGVAKSANMMGESLRSYSSARSWGEMSMNSFYTEPKTDTITPDALPQTTTTTLKLDDAANLLNNGGAGGVTDTSLKWVNLNTPVSPK